MSTDSANEAVADGVHPRYPLLLSPFTVGGATVRNRVVMAPMERNFGEPDGRVTERTIAHYAERAAGGVGWIDVEATFVSPEGRGRCQQLGLHDDAMIDGFARLVAACHAHDTRVSVELHHAGRHAAQGITGHRPVAPSPLPSPESDGVVCEALDDDGIARVLGDYREAARRATAAGVDAVELHGAHGYLVQQFLSPLTNLRDDRWGGSAAARQEFAIRAVEALRAGTGDAEVAVGCRLSIDEHLPGGFGEEFIADLGRRLIDAGIDYITLNAGAIESPLAISPPMGIGDDGWLAPASKRLRADWGIPVFVAGRFLDAATGERALRDGAADAIVFGRALLADPALIEKSARGAESDVVPCTSCNQGCVARIGQQLDATCTVNPRMGREFIAGDAPTAPSATLTVIGGGPAGMSAAVEAARAGHRVVLHEAGPILGGRLRTAICDARPGWRRFLDHLERRLDQLGVEIRLESMVDRLDQLSTDGVIVATGAYVDELSLRADAPTDISIVSVDNALAVPAAGSRVVISGGDPTAVGAAVRLVELGVDVAAVVSPSTVDDPVLGGLDGAIEWLAERGCRFVGRHVPQPEAGQIVRLSAVGAIGSVTPQLIAGVDALVVADHRLPNRLPAPADAGWLDHIGDAHTPGDVRSACASAHLAVHRFALHLANSTTHTEDH